MLEARSKATHSTGEGSNFDEAKNIPCSQTQSHSSDDDLQAEEMFPQAILLNEAGQTEPLTFELELAEDFVRPQLNNICPLCAQKCSQPSCQSNISVLGCRFRAHYFCLRSLESTVYKIRGYPTPLQKGAIAAGSRPTLGQVTPLATRVSLTLTVSHLLTNLTFVSLDRRLKVGQAANGDRLVNCNLAREGNTLQRGYEPNYVCLPLTDLLIELELDLSLTEPPKRFEFAMVFDPSHKFEKKSTFTCSCGPVTLEFDVCFTDLKPITSLMNYKYKYSDSPMVVVKMLSYLLDPVEGESRNRVQVAEQQPAPFLYPTPLSIPQAQPMDEWMYQQRDQNHPTTPQFKHQECRSEQDNYGFNGFNTNYQTYMNQQFYQQRGYDYLSERSAEQNQFSMFGQGMNMMSYGMMPQQYGAMHHQMQQMQHMQMQQQLQMHQMQEMQNMMYQNAPMEPQSQPSLTKKTSAYDAEDPMLDVPSLTYQQIYELIEKNKLKQMAGTNMGSRQIQKYLRKCPAEEVEWFLSSVYDQLVDYVVSEYGNYMFQSVINACNVEQRTRVVKKLCDNFVEMSKNKQGTHCLQALVTKITTKTETKLIVDAVIKRLIEASEELNSSYFVIKIIHTFSLEEMQGIYLAICDNFVRLSQNKSAVLVLKAFIMKIKEREEFERVFVMLIANNLEQIIQDPFGNYVVQHAYDTFKHEKCRPITNRLIEKLPQYSIQKFSSCVVEKCLSQDFNLSEEIVKEIQAGMLQSVSENTEALQEMLKYSLASNILQRLAKRNKNHVIIQNICKVLSLPRMSKYTSGWETILYDHKEKSATCKNIKGQSFSNFAQAVQHRQKVREPKKGSRTPNIK